MPFRVLVSHEDQCRIQMLAFIQSQPNIVERLLRHVETPSIVDMLVRILQLDEQPGGIGVLEVRHYLSFLQRI